MFDVQLETQHVNWGTIWMIGFAYQFWLILAFMASSIPVVGPPLGDAMTRAMTSAQGAPLCQDPEEVPRTRVSMNYLYFYLLVDCLWHKFFGNSKQRQSQEVSDLSGSLLNENLKHA